MLPDLSAQCKEMTLIEIFFSLPSSGLLDAPTFKKLHAL